MSGINGNGEYGKQRRTLRPTPDRLLLLRCHGDKWELDVFRRGSVEPMGCQLTSNFFVAFVGINVRGTVLNTNAL